MGGVDSGLILGRIPYTKAGSGSRRAVISLGGNALIKSLDRSNAGRHAATFGGLPADYSSCIPGYEEDPPEAYGLDAVVGDLERIVGTELARPVDGPRGLLRRVRGLAGFLTAHETKSVCRANP